MSERRGATMKKLAFLMHKGFEGRFRVKEFIPFFEAAGVEVKLLRVPAGFLARLRIFRRLAEFDVVIIQRKLLTSLDLLFVKRYARRIVFDFDDAIMFRSSRHKDQGSGQRMRRFAAMMKTVDAAIAGNSYLADQAARYISRDRIFIVPTVVDVTEYGVKDYSRTDEKFVVGWIGTSTNLQYVEQIVPALEMAGRRVKNLALKIVCDRFIDIDGVEVIKKPWRPDDVSEDLMSFDVGIMPISDDSFTRGKCGLKVVQYFAAGVPAVVSPVGINRDLVIPGQTGLWAEGIDEWAEQLEKLAANRELCRKMGLAGRRLVEEKFSLETTAPRYLDILRSVQKRRRDE
jgi:hypothetical protein